VLDGHKLTCNHLLLAIVSNGIYSRGGGGQNL